MKIIDLSHTIQNGMQIYPGDLRPSIKRGFTHEEDDCHVDALELGTHTGTHIDAPYHFLKAGMKIDETPIQRFIGHGILIDVSHKSAMEPIGAKDIKPYAGQIKAGDFIILKTGWDIYFNTPKYFEHPFLNAEAALFMLEGGVSLVGIDAMSPDPTFYDAVSLDPHAKAEESDEAYGYPAHEILLGNNILIVENLCNLDDIHETKGMYSFLPLRLAHSDGSPIRAVFMSTP